MSEQAKKTKDFKKVHLNKPSNKQESYEAVETMRAWCLAYAQEADRYMKGVKVAGKNARRNLHNIVNNAPTVNKAMIDNDKGEW